MGFRKYQGRSRRLERLINRKQPPSHLSLSFNLRTKSSRHWVAMVINAVCVCIPGSVDADQCCVQVKSGATGATDGRDPQSQHAPTTAQGQVSALPTLF